MTHTTLPFPATPPLQVTIAEGPSGSLVPPLPWRSKQGERPLLWAPPCTGAGGGGLGSGGEAGIVSMFRKELGGELGPAIQSGSGHSASGWGVFGCEPSLMKTSQVPSPCLQCSERPTLGATQGQEAWDRHSSPLTILLLALRWGAAGSGWRAYPLDSWGGSGAASPSSVEAQWLPGPAPSGVCAFVSSSPHLALPPLRLSCLPLAPLSLFSLSLLLSQSLGPVYPQQ